MAYGARRKSLWDSSSDVTAGPFWVGDATNLDLFLRGSPSTTTVQVSNADGFGSSIPENSWSDVTTNVSPSPDMIDINTGPRWFRALRSETTEGVLAIQDRGENS